MSLHLTSYVDMVDVNTVLERLDPTLLDRLGDPTQTAPKPC